MANRYANPIVWTAVMPGEDFVFRGGEEHRGSGVIESPPGPPIDCRTPSRVFKVVKSGAETANLVGCSAFRTASKYRRTPRRGVERRAGSLMARRYPVLLSSALKPLLCWNFRCVGERNEAGTVRSAVQRH